MGQQQLNSYRRSKTRASMLLTSILSPPSVKTKTKKQMLMRARKRTKRLPGRISKMDMAGQPDGSVDVLLVCRPVAEHTVV